MLRFFRKQAPTPPARLEPIEAITASAWEFNEHGWNQLSNEQRAYYRRNLTKAPRYKN